MTPTDEDATSRRILDLFSGCGGWDEGARLAGLHTVGIEKDIDASTTARRAGHEVIQADVTALNPDCFKSCDGLIASPPCTDFSHAGQRRGIDGDTGRLMWEVPRWVDTIRPRWIACEQVPPALGWWETFAEHFSTIGYAVWTGIVNSADYGVPQTRKRAILIARRDAATVTPPPPTHHKHASDSLLGSKHQWISAGTALGWGEPIGRPVRVINTGRDWKKGGTRDDAQKIPETSPAPTVTSNSTRTWIVHDEGSSARAFMDAERNGDPHVYGYRLTIADALRLQSFPSDYPIVGTTQSQWTQVGNAIPPLLAAAIVKHVTHG